MEVTLLDLHSALDQVWHSDDPDAIAIDVANTLAPSELLKLLVVEYVIETGAEVFRFDFESSSGVAKISYERPVVGIASISDGPRDGYRLWRSTIGAKDAYFLSATLDLGNTKTFFPGPTLALVEFVRDHSESMMFFPPELRFAEFGFLTSHFSRSDEEIRNALVAIPGALTALRKGSG